jgi:hypothetical protein
VVPSNKTLRAAQSCERNLRRLGPLIFSSVKAGQRESLRSRCSCRSHPGISRSTRTPPTVAQSSRRSAVRSSRSPKSVVCITVTSCGVAQHRLLFPATGPRHCVPFFLLTQSLYLPENLVPPGKADGQITRTPPASYQSPEARACQTTTDIHRASRTRFWRRTPSGAPRRRRPGARSSPTTSVTWSRSTSLRSQPLTGASSSCWSCSPTIGGASSTSTDRASHRRMDGPAGRGRLPGRLRAVLPPPRSRHGLRRRLPANV